MKTKQTALILMFFMYISMCITGCGTLFWTKSSLADILPPRPVENVKQEVLPTNESSIEKQPASETHVTTLELPKKTAVDYTGDAVARFIPVTSDIVNSIQSAGAKLEDLRFYLSKPLSITIIERNNAPRKFEVNDTGTLIVSREQNALPRRVDFSTSVYGTMRNNDNGASLFIIDFTVDGNDIPLRFVKNSQGLYDLFSAEVQTRPYSIRSDDGVPQLCIFAELNEHMEVRAIFDSAQNDNRRVASFQPNYGNIGNIGPSVEKVNFGSPSPSGQFSGRPSIYIDGTGSVNKRDVTNYVTRRNPSVDRAVLSRLIDTYFDEAGVEGINHDIAIAQMLYATDFLRNRMATRNYGGLSTNGLRWNGRFDDMRTGVRAHIQHLKGYASTSRPRGQIVDPRYQILVDLGYRGRVRTFDQLCRRWSENPAYGNSINRILNGLYDY